MKKTYKLDRKTLKKVLKENLISFILPIILFCTCMYFIESKNEERYYLAQLGFIVVILIFNLPKFILLIDYYIKNKATTLEIDTEFKNIGITKKGNSKKYNFSDIETSIYHVGLYYKNAVDNVSRESPIHSKFGYWDLKFKNGDRYYLSSLLVDFLHEHPFIKKTRYRFRFLPYIHTSYAKKGVKLERKVEKEKTNVEKFVAKYKSKNEKQLRDILDNKNKYQEDAVKAVIILLKSKNIGNDM